MREGWDLADACKAMSYYTTNLTKLLERIYSVYADRRRYTTIVPVSGTLPVQYYLHTLVELVVVVGVLSSPSGHA